MNAIRLDIRETRASMAASVNSIEERLSPAIAKQQIADLKETVVAEFHDAKEQIRNDIAQDLAGAKSAIESEFHGAKMRIAEEYENARAAAYDATVGKVNAMVINAREAVVTAGDATMSAVRDNPIPVALIALGTGWLVMGAFSARREQFRAPRSRSDRERAYRAQDPRPAFGSPYGSEQSSDYMFDPGQGRADRDARPFQSADRLRFEREETADGEPFGEGLAARAGDAAVDARKYVGKVVSDVGESASKLAHEVGDSAVQFSSDARAVRRKLARDARTAARSVGRQVIRAEKAVERGYEVNPLAFGVGALAAGALVGLAVPYTTREDRWFGGTKDKLLASAHEAARGVIESAGDAVANAAEAVESDSDDATDPRPLTRKDEHTKDWFSGDRDARQTSPTLG
jgi:hypothetical protein